MVFVDPIDPFSGFISRKERERERARQKAAPLLSKLDELRKLIESGRNRVREVEELRPQNDPFSDRFGQTIFRRQGQPLRQQNDPFAERISRPRVFGIPQESFPDIARLAMQAREHSYNVRKLELARSILGPDFGESYRDDPFGTLGQWAKRHSSELISEDIAREFGPDISTDTLEEAIRRYGPDDPRTQAINAYLFIATKDASEVGKEIYKSFDSSLDTIVKGTKSRYSQELLESLRRSALSPIQKKQLEQVDKDLEELRKELSEHEKIKDIQPTKAARSAWERRKEDLEAQISALEKQREQVLASGVTPGVTLLISTKIRETSEVEDLLRSSVARDILQPEKQSDELAKLLREFEFHDKTVKELEAQASSGNWIDQARLNWSLAERDKLAQKIEQLRSGIELRENIPKTYDEFLAKATATRLMLSPGDEKQFIENPIQYLLDTGGALEAVLLWSDKVPDGALAAKVTDEQRKIGNYFYDVLEGMYDGPLPEDEDERFEKVITAYASRFPQYRPNLLDIVAGDAPYASPTEQIVAIGREVDKGRALIQRGLQELGLPEAISYFASEIATTVPFIVGTGGTGAAVKGAMWSLRASMVAQRAYEASLVANPNDRNFLALWGIGLTDFAFVSAPYARVEDLIIKKAATGAMNTAFRSMLSDPAARAAARQFSRAMAAGGTNLAVDIPTALLYMKSAGIDPKSEEGQQFLRTIALFSGGVPAASIAVSPVLRSWWKEAMTGVATYALSQAGGADKAESAELAAMAMLMVAGIRRRNQLEANLARRTEGSLLRGEADGHLMMGFAANPIFSGNGGLGRFAYKLDHALADPNLPDEIPASQVFPLLTKHGVKKWELYWAGLADFDPQVNPEIRNARWKIAKDDIRAMADAFRVPITEWQVVPQGPQHFPELLVGSFDSPRVEPIQGVARESLENALGTKLDQAFGYGEIFIARDTNGSYFIGFDDGANFLLLTQTQSGLPRMPTGKISWNEFPIIEGQLKQELLNALRGVPDSTLVQFGQLASGSPSFRNAYQEFSTYGLPGTSNYRSLIVGYDASHFDILQRWASIRKGDIEDFAGTSPQRIEHTFPRHFAEGVNPFLQAYHLRLTDWTMNGKKYLFVEEIQSDFSIGKRTLAKAGMEVEEGPIGFKDWWLTHGIRRAIVEAIDGGYDGIIFAGPGVQNTRWAGYGPSFLYTQILPKRLADEAQKTFGLDPPTHQWFPVQAQLTPRQSIMKGVATVQNTKTGNVFSAIDGFVIDFPNKQQLQAQLGSVAHYVLAPSKYNKLAEEAWRIARASVPFTLYLLGDEYFGLDEEELRMLAFVTGLGVPLLRTLWEKDPMTARAVAARALGLGAGDAASIAGTIIGRALGGDLGEAIGGPLFRKLYESALPKIQDANFTLLKIADSFDENELPWATRPATPEWVDEVEQRGHIVVYKAVTDQREAEKLLDALRKYPDALRWPVPSAASDGFYAEKRAEAIQKVIDEVFEGNEQFVRPVWASRYPTVAIGQSGGAGLLVAIEIDPSKPGAILFDSTQDVEARGSLAQAATYGGSEIIINGTRNHGIVDIRFLSPEQQAQAWAQRVELGALYRGAMAGPDDIPPGELPPEDIADYDPELAVQWREEARKLRPLTRDYSREFVRAREEWLKEQRNLALGLAGQIKKGKVPTADEASFLRKYVRALFRGRDRLSALVGPELEKQYRLVLRKAQQLGGIDKLSDQDRAVISRYWKSVAGFLEDNLKSESGHVDSSLAVWMGIGGAYGAMEYLQDGDDEDSAFAKGMLVAMFGMFGWKAIPELQLRYSVRRTLSRYTRMMGVESIPFPAAEWFEQDRRSLGTKLINKIGPWFVRTLGPIDPITDNIRRFLVEAVPKIDDYARLKAARAYMVIRDNFKLDSDFRVVRDDGSHIPVLRPELDDQGRIVYDETGHVKYAPVLDRVGDKRVPSKATLADIAGAPNLYLREGYITQEQYKALMELKLMLARTNRELEEKFGVSFNRRPDVFPELGGFYFPRGSATKKVGDEVIEEDVGLLAVRSRRLRKAPEHRPIVFSSQSEGISNGYVYLMPHEALGLYVQHAYKEGVANKLAEFLTSVRGEDGMPLAVSRPELMDIELKRKAKDLGLGIDEGTSFAEYAKSVRDALQSLRRRTKTAEKRVQLYEKQHKELLRVLAYLDGRQEKNQLRGLRTALKRAGYKKRDIDTILTRYHDALEQAIDKEVERLKRQIQRRAEKRDAMAKNWQQQLNQLQAELEQYQEAAEKIAQARQYVGKKGVNVPPGYTTISLPGLEREWYLPVYIAARVNEILDTDSPDAAARFMSDLVNLMRTMQATGDMSAIGITTLLGGYQNPRAAVGMAALATELTFRAFPYARVIEKFDAEAQRTGVPTPEEWVGAGLRIAGMRLVSEERMSEQFLAGLAGVQRFVSPEQVEVNVSQGKRRPLSPFVYSARHFSLMGDLMRLRMANDLVSILPENMRKEPELLQAIAMAVNNVTGIAEKAFGEQLPGKSAKAVAKWLQFAPRFTQATLNTIWYAATKLGIEGGIARSALMRMAAAGVLLTVIANDILGQETVFDPRDPNFLRIRLPGQDVSLFGPWDSLLRGFIATVNGIPMAEVIVPDYKGRKGDVSYFIRSKANPLLSIGFDLWTGESFSRYEVGSLLYWAQRFSPFSVGQITESIDTTKREPWSLAFAIAASILGLKQTPWTPREVLEEEVKAAGINPEDPVAVSMWLDEHPEYQVDPQSEFGKRRKELADQRKEELANIEQWFRLGRSPQKGNFFLQDYLESTRAVNQKYRAEYEMLQGILESIDFPAESQYQQWIEDYLAVFENALASKEDVIRAEFQSTYEGNMNALRAAVQSGAISRKQFDAMYDIINGGTWKPEYDEVFPWMQYFPDDGIYVSELVDENLAKFVKENGEGALQYVLVAMGLNDQPTWQEYSWATYNLSRLKVRDPNTGEIRTINYFDEPRYAQELLVSGLPQPLLFTLRQRVEAYRRTHPELERASFQESASIFLREEMGMDDDMAALVMADIVTIGKESAVNPIVQAAREQYPYFYAFLSGDRVTYEGLQALKEQQKRILRELGLPDVTDVNWRRAKEVSPSYSLVGQ